jgi:hypothetical protein
LVATLTFVDSLLTMASAWRSLLPSVNPLKLSTTLPFSRTSIWNVGGASSLASSAGASGVTATEMGALGSTVVISSAGPRPRSADGRARMPGSVAGVVFGMRTMYARLPPLLK